MTTMEKQHPFPGNRIAFIPTLNGGDSDTADGTERVHPTDDLEQANVLLSEVDIVKGYHRPVIDIDMPVKLIPSSTPGHYHLLIDQAIPWEQYAALLVALGDAGIVQQGYVNSALRRGYTAVRLPWVKKPRSMFVDPA